MHFEFRALCPLLQVYDMPASIAFYCDLLGFAVVSSSPPLPPPRLFHWALLRQGGAELMLNTAYETDDDRPPVENPARLTAHRDTCLYLACPDVEAAFTSLRARGHTVGEPQLAPYGMLQLYLEDPDGFALCLQWPSA